jgi:hypothetical protein
MSTQGAIAFTYVSGSGSNNIILTGDKTVDSGETVTAGLDYTQPGDGIEDISGNDLASIDDHAVVNNSTEGTSCNPALNEVGDRTDLTEAYSFTSGENIRIILYTADCSGTLEYAYMRHYSNNTDNVKICAYTDDGDEVPDSSDILIGCSNVITGNATATWFASSEKVGGQVTNGVKYWVAFITDPATGWDVYRNTTTGTRTIYTQSIVGCFDDPPANLAGSWTPTAGRDYSYYIAIE